MSKHDEWKQKVEEVKKQAPPPKIYIREDVKQEPYQAPESKPKKKQHKINVPAKVQKYEVQVKNEEEYEVDDPDFELVKKLRNGELVQEDLTPDEKFIIIRYLRETEKLKQDEIAAELKVSRRTVINYCNKIKKLNAQKLNDTTAMELGGELYQMSMEALREALKSGNFKNFAYVMQTMITVLQSMGLVFKLPAQSQAQVVSANLKDVEGFIGMKNKMTEHDEITIDQVQKDLFAAVAEAEIVKEEEDE